jgi:dTDP-glucose 4,6-dehydratase
MPTSLVTGGAGFLGSNLCDLLLSRGHCVICVDNLDTGSLENIRHLKNGVDFRFEMLDITGHYEVDEPIDFVYHMASPASPIDYARLPAHAQGGRLRHPQHAGTGEEAQGAVPAGFDE